MPKIVRSHDTFYLNENRYENTKESFKFLGELMIRQKNLIVLDNQTEVNPSISISDWGCAAGEFPYYLKKIFPNDHIIGFEILPELLKKSIQKVEGVDFILASILNQDSSSENSFHLTCANGILPIFDDFIPIIENLIHWTKPGGSIFLDGLFNDYPCDVNIKYNLAKDHGSGVLESGWNIFSKKSLETFLNKHKSVSRHHFFDFEIPIDLVKQSDPIRTWTEKRLDGSRYMTNGLCIIQPQSMLQIDIVK